MSQNSLFPDMPTRHIPWTDMPEYRPPNEFPRFSEAKRVIFDLETKGLDPLRGGKIIGVALRTDDAKVRDYWPIAHQGGQNCDETKTLQWINDELGKFRGEFLGTNLNLFDGFHLHMKDIRPTKLKWRDIQWAEALIDEFAESYTLNALAKKYLNKSKVSLEDVYGEDVKEYMDEVHPGHMKVYTMGDLDLPAEIYEKQLVVLGKERLTSLFDLECRLTPMLHYMRRIGQRVDIEGAEKLEKRLIGEYQKELANLGGMVGFDVDPFSSDSIARAFDHLGLPYERTDKDNPSFVKKWLKQQKHPFAKALVGARELEKIRGTFVRGYILDGNINGRIHAQFHPLRRADEDGTRGTVSGRFSSSEPNLQNIPVRSALGKEIRELFIADEGMVFHDSDYSQFEYRLLVHYAMTCKCTGAEKAGDMFRNDPNADFHQMVADLTGLPRPDAKNQNFAMVYNQGLQATAETLGMVDEYGNPTQKCLDTIEIYHENAPFIREMNQKAMDQAKKNGFIKTILGRRARFNLFEPLYTGPGQFFTPLPLAEAKRAYGSRIRRAGIRKALNCLLQGSNADGIKKAMVEIWEAGLVGDGLDISLTIHDELGGSVDPSKYNLEKLDSMRQIMQNVFQLKVPLLVSGGTGKNWASAK